MSDEAKYIAASLRRFDRTVDIIALALARLEQQESTDAILREMAEELSRTLDHFRDTVLRLDEESSRSLDRLEDIIFQLSQAIIKILPQRRDTRELSEITIKLRIESLERQLANWTNKLNMYQEQESKFGLSPPIDILTGIIEAQERIEKIKLELEYLER